MAVSILEKRWHNGASVEGDKACADDSVICEATIVNTGRKVRKTNMEIKKPYAVVQYNKFIKGVDRADPYLSYYWVLRKSVKWMKNVVLYLPNCMLFNTFFVYRTLNANKVKYKNFLHEVGRSWMPEVQNRSESNSDDLQLPEKQTSPRGPKKDLPSRLSGDFRIYKLEKILVVGREKRSILQDSVKCVLHIRSEVKLDTFVNSAFRFTKGLVLRNTIHWQIIRLSTCSFCSLGLRSIIYNVKM